ncbi:gloverin-like [Hyposmocoma kahamanoa]|uniref:gloverin-like n=1 Tax=Hyposmocoma kahamanoa TaxID=1477025 RepID=UPI000E6D8A94|nr:gloverin-like [Hyposmocoma kahamanoa]
MKFLIAFGVALAAVVAQEENLEPQYVYVDAYPEWYVQPAVEHQERYRRDVTYSKPVGGGKVFGTLGQNDNGLFGKAGYNRNIFDDHRGKLDGSAYGTRVLGPNGASSHVGGSLNWKNSNAAANLDISKQIHGPSSINAGAGGRWPVGKNGDFSAQGFYGKTSGFPSDYGVRGVYNYRW